MEILYGIIAVPEQQGTGSKCLGRSIYAERGQCLFQNRGVYPKFASVGHQVFDFIESLEKAQLDDAVLFGIGERASVMLSPRLYYFAGKENTYRKGSLAVGGHIENVFLRGFLIALGGNRPIADEIVLINVALPPGVSLHATDGHNP
jgi:hypothetical protein